MLTLESAGEMSRERLQVPLALNRDRSVVPNPTHEVLGVLCFFLVFFLFNVAVPQITSGGKKGTSLVSATNSVLFLIYTLLQQYIHFQCELHLKDCEVHAVTVLKPHMFSLLSHTPSFQMEKWIFTTAPSGTPVSPHSLALASAVRKLCSLKAFSGPPSLVLTYQLKLPVEMNGDDDICLIPVFSVRRRKSENKQM